MIIVCRKCDKFKVPWDEIGVALMKEHLKECNGRNQDQSNQQERTASSS